MSLKGILPASFPPSSQNLAERTFSSRVVGALFWMTNSLASQKCYRRPLRTRGKSGGLGGVSCKFPALGRDVWEWGRGGKRKPFLINLSQWFSTGGDRALQGTSDNAWRRFWLPWLGEGGAPGTWWAETASHSAQGSLYGREWSNPHVHSTEAENPPLNHLSMDRSNAPGRREQHEAIHTNEELWVYV